MKIKITNDINLLALQWNMEYAKLHVGKIYQVDQIDDEGWALVSHEPTEMGCPALVVDSRIHPCCFEVIDND